MSKRSRFFPWFRSPRPDPKASLTDKHAELPSYEGDLEKVLGQDAAREINLCWDRDALAQRLKNCLAVSWTTKPPNLYMGEFQESVLQRLDNHCPFCGVLIHSSLQPASFQYSRVSDLLTVICPICGYAASFSRMDQVSPRFNEMLKELRDAKKERG